MGMKAVSGMFMDWSGIVSILFRPFLGTSPWVSRAENGPTRDSCLARLTHRLALAGIRSKKKKILIHRENLFRPSRGPTQISRTLQNHQVLLPDKSPGITPDPESGQAI